ncbi:hypothetical protein O0I10_000517 [Lichtheimia ornata]|uniref:Uncharacterized protein n=1 Tax=Lichtheimia ornata TaxID=688661 RepID=A0AAD7Y3T2_9FUNG|nr:uncharacterized protein O0I10_000517 [Lichtheimia ornata]KAJ8663279.1 hypothetical protein O0I10_000517 [Lichtheimia ornata]
MSYTARDCCVCHCHYSPTPNATSLHNATTTIQKPNSTLTPPRRWFDKIRRRPSIEQQERRKREMLLQFHHLYHTVQEELLYATESQGSVYYEGDLMAAKEALDAWVHHYQILSRHLDPKELRTLHEQWEDTRKELQESLDKLPSPLLL